MNGVGKIIWGKKQPYGTKQLNNDSLRVPLLQDCDYTFDENVPIHLVDDNESDTLYDSSCIEEKNYNKNVKLDDTNGYLKYNYNGGKRRSSYSDYEDDANLDEFYTASSTVVSKMNLIRVELRVSVICLTIEKGTVVVV